MARLNSEISQWEKRIKNQGKAPSKKRDGLPSQKESSPDNETKRQGCDDAQTIVSIHELVKPDLIHTPKQRATVSKIEHDSDSVKSKINRAAFDNPAGAKYKTKEDKSVRPTKAVQKYISIWNASLFPRLREFRSAKDEGVSKQTKTYQTVVRLLQKLIRGTLYDGSEPSVRFPAGFRRQSLRVPIERFQYLITNLEKKAFNSDYKPRNKTYLIKTTLPFFLVGNGKFGVSPSLLLDYALTPAIPNINTKSKDPRLSEVFRELFLFKANRIEDTLTFAERNHLVGASNKYLDFFTRFKEPFEVYGYKDPIDFLDEYYWKAISDSWPGKKIRKIPLNYLNSGVLIDRVIVPYFLKIGMLKDYDFEGATKEYWG